MDIFCHFKICHNRRNGFCSAYDYISVFGLELGGWTTTQWEEAMLTQAKIGHCDNVLKSLEENSFQKTYLAAA